MNILISLKCVCRQIVLFHKNNSLESDERLKMCILDLEMDHFL